MSMTISRSSSEMEHTVVSAKHSDSSDQASLTVIPAVSCSLKRKRPPKIEIPNVLREIHTDTKLKSRDSQSQEDNVCFTGFGVGVSSIKGKKMFMEDTHKILSSSHDANKRFFGVYDGHGGCKAAKFVADNLDTNILEMLENSTTKEEAIKAAYLKTDHDFLKQGYGSGTCCVTAVVEGKELIVSNVGDCRAVLCRGGKAEALTKDHRASNEDERKRIEDMGGYVEIKRGGWRVHGVLSVSRSIGDSHLKDWVVAEPDTKILSLTKDMQFLLLASDGLWDEVGNQEAVDIVMRSFFSEKKVEECEYDGFGCVSSTSPSPKLRRVKLVKQKRRTGQSPVCTRKFVVDGDSFKENENESCRPCKAQRVSFVNQTKIKIQSSDLENNSVNRKGDYDGLVGVCKELANLAVSRGSFDDITVMIIDLNHYNT